MPSRPPSPLAVIGTVAIAAACLLAPVAQVCVAPSPAGHDWAGRQGPKGDPTQQPPAPLKFLQFLVDPNQNERRNSAPTGQWPVSSLRKTA